MPIIDLINTQMPYAKGKYNISQIFNVSNPIVRKEIEDLGIDYPKDEIIELNGTPEEFDKIRIFDKLFYESPY